MKREATHGSSRGAKLNDKPFPTEAFAELIKAYLPEQVDQQKYKADAGVVHRSKLQCSQTKMRTQLR
jgi:hypothetical protein